MGTQIGDKGDYMRFLSVAVSFMLFLISIKIAECGVIDQEKQKELLRQLQSNKITVRSIGLSNTNTYFKSIEMPQNIKSQILHLAEVEQKGSESLISGEAGEEYFAELVIALGNTREPQAIPYLMNYIGNGTIVSRSLVRIGEPAIEVLIHALNNNLVVSRIAAAQALGEFIKPKTEGYTATGEVRQKIKIALIRELKEPRNQNPRLNIKEYEYRARECADVRRTIVTALGNLAESGDKDALLNIQAIANEDPYYFVVKGGTKKGTKRYDVRDEAEKVLQKLKAGGIIK